MTEQHVATREEWLVVRKELTRHSDELARQRQELLQDGIVDHTYSCYDRGTDVIDGNWQLLV